MANAVEELLFFIAGKYSVSQRTHCGVTQASVRLSEPHAVPFVCC
jgi:hypothetical protein